MYVLAKFKRVISRFDHMSVYKFPQSHSSILAMKSNFKLDFKSLQSISEVKP